MAVHSMSRPQRFADTMLKPFEIMRSDIEVSYYVTKFAIQAFKGISLVLRSIPTPLAKTFSFLTSFDLVLDTALIFPCASATNRKPLSLKRWLFLGATVAGLVLFFHEISLIQLGKAAAVIGGLTCALVAGGYAVSSIKHILHKIHLHPQKSSPAVPRWVKIAHGISSVAFFSVCAVGISQPVLLVALGLVATGFGAVKTMWNPWKHRSKKTLSVGVE